MAMAEYIACRSCDSPDCKGCNLKRLETMLENGKFECLMNENRAINALADVVPVRHGQWVEYQVPPIICCSNCDWATDVKEKNFNYCPKCGAKMGDKLYG